VASSTLNFKDHLFLDFSRRHSLKDLPDRTRRRLIASLFPDLDYLVLCFFELFLHVKRHSYWVTSPLTFPEAMVRASSLTSLLCPSP
jgi:hypothetical protein